MLQILYRILLFLLTFILSYKFWTDNDNWQTTLYTINSPVYETTEELVSGDFVEQRIPLSARRLDTLQAAIAYSDPAPEGTVLFQVLYQDSVICEQALSISACPNQSVITLHTDLKGEIGEYVTLRISNISESNAAFSVLCTTDPYGMMAQAPLMSSDRISPNGQLISILSYRTDFNWYQPLSFSFIMLLTIVCLWHLPEAIKGFYKNQNRRFLWKNQQ